MEPPPFSDGNDPVRHGWGQAGCSFNGATAFQRWKHPRPAGDQQGNCPFNGATAFQRWKPAPKTGRGPQRYPFNGATAFQRWKPEEVQELKAAYEALQWSHRLSAMETPKTVSPMLTTWALQWSHRLSAMETTQPPQKHKSRTYLQWSHRLSAMETFYGRVCPGCQHAPSMEPPPFSDGNGQEPAEQRPPVMPSMEPPPFSDGNACASTATPTRRSTFNGATAFQRWKQGYPRRRQRQGDALQWSHRLSAMETTIWQGLPGPGRTPSMEPPPFSDGNTCSHSVSFGNRRAFNGATAFQRWKPVLHRREAHRQGAPFNGATAFQRWKHLQPEH